jgi:hypothetical protein
MILHAAYAKSTDPILASEKRGRIMHPELFLVISAATPMIVIFFQIQDQSEGLFEFGEKTIKQLK